MKCGLCERPLSHLNAVCDCGRDPNAGWIMHNRYQLLGLIGQGGMGMIYRAVDQQTQQLCAIKISRWSEALQQLRHMESAEAKAEERARVEREFKLLEKAASRSSHVVQVFDSFREDPRLGCYYPMEFLEGQPLSKIPEWGSPMPPQQVVPLILQLCAGVGVAHGLGVVHRDLNPDNIFIVRTPEHERFVKLIDFGIARDLYARKGIYNTGSDLAFGHLHYLAPEQVGYDPVADTYQKETAARLDHRADIYSLGAIMFHMLTGVPPFDDGTLEGLALRNWRKPPHVAQAIKESFLPDELQGLILACLQPMPNLRVPDILALSDMLQSYLYGQRSEEAFDALLEHASQSPDILVQEEKPEPHLDASWEFPAVEGGWNLPSVELSTSSSGSELSIFSQEFNSIYVEEDIPAGGLDFRDTGELRPSSPALPPPPPPKEARRSTPPPPPPRAFSQASATPTGELAFSAVETPVYPPSTPLPSSPPAVTQMTPLPSDIMNSLDNAPAISDWDEDETEHNSASPPAIVIDHHRLDVRGFFSGVEQIVESHHKPTLSRQSPYYEGPAQRSPQLEALLSRDNLDLVASLAPNLQDRSSSDWLASELLVDMEIEEHVETVPRSLSSPSLAPSETAFSRPAGVSDSVFPPSVTPHQSTSSRLWLWILLAALGLLGLGYILYTFVFQ